MHPSSVVGPLSEPGNLDSDMRVVLMFSAVTFTALFALLVRERVLMRRSEDTLRLTRYSARTAAGR